MSLFGTAGIRGDARERVTPALALRVGRAAANEAGGEVFVVGRDGRETGPALAAALEAGLSAGGARVLRVGRVPTPALAFASRKFILYHEISHVTRNRECKNKCQTGTGHGGTRGS
jgi:phosphomannomutase